MKERPIIFSAPMVRAILDGRKTQTRRMVKPQPHAGVRQSPFVHSGLEDGHGCEIRHKYGVPGDRLWVRESFTFVNCDRERLTICVAPQADGPDLPTRTDLIVTPEQFASFMGDERVKRDPFEKRKYPSIHMPRWASRITLEITGVRVERLNEISESDCWAEGIEEIDGMFDQDIYVMAKRIGVTFEDARPTYACLWESIHGPKSWDENQWVWVLTFRRVM